MQNRNVSEISVNSNQDNLMKVVMLKKSVLELKKVEKPIPKDNEVLIKVHATAINSGDVNLKNLRSKFLFWLLMRIFYGLKKPEKLVLGTALSGEIESIGKSVTRFKKGDLVFASTGMNFGANAEYVSIPETGTLAEKPTTMSHQEASAVPFGALTALYFLRKGNIQQGQKVLINGASGSVGSFAVQLAKYFGAEVTGVSSTKKLELVKSLGADNVIDYKREDFTDREEKYDVIFDVAGKSSKSHSKKVLAPKGIFLSSKKGLAEESAENLNFLKELIEASKLRSVIDKNFPLEEILEAYSYAETGQKVGNLVITL